MTTLTLPSNHDFFNRVQKIQKICKPLFANDNITFFDYGRFGKNGDFNAFTTNGDSIRIFFDLEYECLKSHKHFPLKENRYSYHYAPPPQSFSNSNDSYAAQEVQRVTGSDNGFTILKKQADFIDIYYFCSPLPRDTAINYYLNKLPLLHQFITYFQNQISHLDDASPDTSIILPSKMRPQIWQLSLTQDSSKIYRYINDGEDEVILTKRQKDCAEYICQGYTNKQIANVLALSQRTIESYLEQLKRKFNIQKKSELIRYLLHNQHIND